ncbi:MAG: hypothetical protein HY958_08660 [Bacteroidia bacterium]|nr:hypothetical protein [Bacteroidia bacterium]
MKNYLLTIILLLICSFLFSQGEIAETDKIFIKNENTFGMMFNSNGFGVNYRYGKRKDAFNKKIFEADLSIIKHLKEIKVTSTNPFIDSQKRFVFGKLNETVSLRAGYGKQKEVFSKFDKNSISIKYFYLFGGSLVFLKPIYYEMVDWDTINNSTNTYIYYTGYHKFSNSLHMNQDIIGKAPFKTGLNEIAVIPGIYAKAGLSFEYSNTDTLIRAIETGVCIDIFPKKLPIMADDPDKSNMPQISVSLFLTYRFGRVLNGRKKHHSYRKKIFSGKKDKKGVGEEEPNNVIKEEEPNIEEY